MIDTATSRVDETTGAAMRRLRLKRHRAESRRRRGAATLDYVLVLGAVFALASLIVPAGMRIARAAYDMLSVLISWPFL